MPDNDPLEQELPPTTTLVDVDQPGSERREEISAELRMAGLLTSADDDASTTPGDLAAADTSVLVDAYIVSDGLPSRVVHSGEFAPPLPDLTRTESGREILAQLRAQLSDRLAPGSEPEGDSPPDT